MESGDRVSKKRIRLLLSCAAHAGIVPLTRQKRFTTERTEITEKSALLAWVAFGGLLADAQFVLSLFSVFSVSPW